MKVALVHDYLVRFGGAERVLLALSEIFPQAPIFTLLYNHKEMNPFFKKADIRTSFLQKIPLSQSYYRGLAPLMPSAVEDLDLRDYDLIISSASAFAKGLVLRPKTIHICYCHSPTRFLWDWTHPYQEKSSFIKKGVLHYLRLWDRSAANRVDYFLANSETTAQRIKKYYGRESKVIYPPVNLCKKEQGDVDTLKEEYFLIVSQLSPYKRIDLAIDAFNKLELPLVIIGQGRDYKRLKKMAGPNIHLMGWLPDDLTRSYYKNCAGFIFPGEDDFGITVVEAMSHGKPILAYRKGGATETMIEGVTGEFFNEPVTESLVDGIRRLRGKEYSLKEIQERAEKFSEDEFKKKFKQTLIDILEKKSF